MTEFQEFEAPAQWRVIDFISDLHLQGSEPETFQAWKSYLQSTAADAVFMLGDLFEVWVGDDIANPPPQPPTADSPHPHNLHNSSDAPAGEFERECANVLKAAAHHTQLFFMHGNRDFLLGQAFLAACGTQLLADPTILLFGGQRWLLSHGDELCLADTDYQKFRSMVRGKPWQGEFLSKPLPERIELAKGLRAQSEARKNTSRRAHFGTPADFFDVDSAAAAQWLMKARATTLIHGHTHRPGHHVLADASAHRKLERVVLSDWDAAAKPPRLEVVRLSQDAGAARLSRIPLSAI